ncbi:MAG: LpxI family protein [Terriglobia bacterium]
MGQSIHAPEFRYAIIAGNGHFPFLVLRAARAQGIEPLVIAIREEASASLSEQTRSIHWLSLGEITKLMDLLDASGIHKVILAGQVKHVQLFSAIRPDKALDSALTGLQRRNTDALIGAFVQMLEGRGMEVLDSTLFLKPLLAGEGCFSRRQPDRGEMDDAGYGREIAKKMAELDVGQTVVVADRACVAVEAMEGTDATIERAAGLSNGRRLVVVKVSKPRQDMRFDVPVVGATTIEVMKRSNATVLSMDAGKTLLFDRDWLLKAADDSGISLVGVKDS